MKCYKCGKEMGREDDSEVIKGIVVDVSVSMSPTKTAQEIINHNNLQLGKYSNGKGECHIGICYECYIDGLFNIK